MASYTQGFRASMVERILMSERIGAYALSKEPEVNRVTLARWIGDAHRIEHMGSKKRSIQESCRQTCQRSAEEEPRLPIIASTLSDEEWGALLLSEGLHEAKLKEGRATSIVELRETDKKIDRSPETIINKDLREELLRKDCARAGFADLLSLKKIPGHLEGQERPNPFEATNTIIGLIDEAMSAGMREGPTRKLLSAHRRTLQRWCAEGIGEDAMTGPNSNPPSKLTADDKDQILTIANTPFYSELFTNKIVARLGDLRVYVTPESSFSRLHRDEG